MRKEKKKKMTKLEMIQAREKQLKRIWRNEGVDATLACAKPLGLKRYDVWLLIEGWLFKKQSEQRRELEQLGRESIEDKP